MKGYYSHLIQFRNEDGNFRQIRCHAVHVAEHMQRLIPFANKGVISGLSVSEM